MADHKKKNESKLTEDFKDIIAKAKEKKAAKDKDSDGKDSKSEDDDDGDKKDKDDKSKDKKESKDKDVKEDTSAMNSLHPHSTYTEPMSRSSMMKDTLHVMSSMDSSGMLDFFKKTMDQFGPNKSLGTTDKSSENQNSLNMHPSNAIGKGGVKHRESMPKLGVKEDLEVLFGADENLSEEFKESATTIFEAAVTARIIQETTRLEEEYAEAFVEELEQFRESTTNNLNSYLDYVVESFVKENEVAIESSLRNEISAEFIEGLKNLFAEHYMEVPESKINVMEALAEKVSELEEKLNESIEKNDELNRAISENRAKGIFEDVSTDLADTQKEKFAALAEGIEFDGDEDRYSRKLNVIKDRYFSENKEHTTNLNEETFEGETEQSTKQVNPMTKNYADFITKSVKKVA